MSSQHARPHWGVVLIIFYFRHYFNSIVTTIPFIGLVNHREIEWERKWPVGPESTVVFSQLLLSGKSMISATGRVRLLRMP